MIDLNELPKKYPSLFKNESFHFECGNGWYELLDVLLSILELRQRRGSVPSDDIEITQIKQKFGGLRFYCHGVDDYCYGMIDLAEKISTRICEECGNPGRLMTTHTGWLYTACEEHKTWRDE